MLEHAQNKGDAFVGISFQLRQIIDPICGFSANGSIAQETERQDGIGQLMVILLMTTMVVHCEHSSLNVQGYQ
jgi:hypothetical protein